MGKWVLILKEMDYGGEWIIHSVHGPYPSEDAATDQGPWLVAINKQKEEVWDFDVFRLTK